MNYKKLLNNKLVQRIGFIALAGAAVAVANYLSASGVAGTSTVVIVLGLRELDKYLEKRASSTNN